MCIVYFKKATGNVEDILELEGVEQKKAFGKDLRQFKKLEKQIKQK